MTEITSIQIKVLKMWAVFLFRYSDFTKLIPWQKYCHIWKENRICTFFELSNIYVSKLGAMFQLFKYFLTLHRNLFHLQKGFYSNLIVWICSYCEYFLQITFRLKPYLLKLDTEAPLKADLCDANSTTNTDTNVKRQKQQRCYLINLED